MGFPGGRKGKREKLVRRHLFPWDRKKEKKMREDKSAWNDEKSSCKGLCLFIC